MRARRAEPTWLRRCTSADHSQVSAWSLQFQLYPRFLEQVGLPALAWLGLAWRINFETFGVSGSVSAIGEPVPIALGHQGANILSRAGAPVDQRQEADILFS